MSLAALVGIFSRGTTRAKGMFARKLVQPVYFSCPHFLLGYLMPRPFRKAYIYFVLGCVFRRVLLFVFRISQLFYLGIHWQTF